MSKKGPSVLTQEWCDLVKEFYNNDKVVREATRGMNNKIYYVATGCPGGVDKIVVWEFEDGMMKEMKIAAEAPAPCKEWKSFNLPFPVKDWWGGWIAPYHACIDIMDPIEEPGKPVRVREDIVQLLSDGRITVGVSPMKVYPIKKQLQAWMDSMSRAQNQLKFERPAYIPNGKDAC